MNTEERARKIINDFLDCNLIYNENEDKQCVECKEMARMLAIKCAFVFINNIIEEYILTPGSDDEYHQLKKWYLVRWEIVKTINKFS